MTEQEKQLVKAKKAQCWIGIALLVPAVFGVLSVVCGVLDLGDLFGDWMENFAELYNLDGVWYGDGEGATAPAPLFMGMCAFVGAYLIKDNMHYLCIKTKEDNNEKKPEEQEN